jgi:uncharacterized membrane protein YgaE (UPF0421/DUF939 family)
MDTRSIIILVTWICVTVLSVTIVWVTQQLDIWNVLFILLLIGIAFSVTFAIPFGLPAIEHATEKQITKILKQLQELNQKMDYIKRQLEE